MAIHNRRYPLGHIITAKYMQAVENNGLHITQADSGWAKFGWGNIYGQWICGCAILGYDPIRFDAYRFRKMLKKYKPTSMCVPPTMYRLMLTDGLESEDVQAIKHFSTAGEPLSGEINKEFFYLTGKYIFEGYGQSESTPFTCTFKYLDVKPSSMGRPSPLYDIRLLKSDGTFAKINEPGEVVIMDAKNCLGLLDHYVLNDQRINSLDDNGIYHTGDIAYMDNDGYFWYVSRNDDMIKSSGYRIGPFEIESVLNTHPAVTESAIIGLPDPIRGQIICAVIHLAEGYTPSYELTKELQNYVKVNTAPYKYPRAIIYAKELPKTTSGKIIRHDILKQIEINPVKEKSCGAIIYKYENGGLRFLISKHKQGHYSFTKGHVENNETEVETALREIREETNLEVKLDTGFREINTYSPRLGSIKDVIYFIATPTTDELKVQEHEIIEALWLSYEDSLKTITNDSDKEILKKAYAYLK
jgi:acetyl-CoA synthetase